jgi:DNA-binding NarL/FixJ family response regulator
VGVVIVEDEFLIAPEAEMLLQDAGHTVIGTAATEDDAVALARSEGPDVVVVDLRLAGETCGRRGVERIRAVQVRPIVFVTGNLDPATRGETARLRASGDADEALFRRRVDPRDPRRYLAPAASRAA